jgi:hypothetical protein
VDKTKLNFLIKLPLRLIVLCAMTLIPMFSWAQGGGRIHYSNLYDPGTVQTVQGEVLNVGKAISGNGRDFCRNLTLRTAKEKLLVIMEPERYAMSKGHHIPIKEKLEVTGSRITLMGKPAIIAAEIKQADAIIRLRDPAGRPAWAVGDDWHIH